MSGRNTPNGQPDNSSVARYLELDVSKLHSLPSEQQDLYLLTFVSDLVRHVQGLDNDTLPAHQASIKKQLIIVLHLSSPTPSRPIRNNLGLIYAEIYARGSRSRLYETINELVDIINAAKTEKDLKNKHAAVVCLGQVLKTTGDTALSLSASAVISLLKLVRQAQNDAGPRAAIYKALGRIVHGVGFSIEEHLARDVWKWAKAAASTDKSLLCQKTACYCLEMLITATPYFDNGNDFDALKNALWKTFESSASRVRHAAASVLASAFTKLFSEIDPPTSIRKTTKTSKKGPPGLDVEDQVDVPASLHSKKQPVALSLSLHEVLQTLGSHYTKSSTTNRTRAGLAVCYKYSLSRLPEKVVEERYGDIANHFFDDLLSHPTISYSRYRLLFSRQIVKTVLDATVGFRILSESAQVSAAHWLLANVLKHSPRSASEQRMPTKQATIAALGSLSNFVTCLGPAASTLADTCRETLLHLLQATSYTVQVYVSDCLRNLALACPQQLLLCTNSCIEYVKESLPQLKDSPILRRRCSGYANTLAAVIGTSRSRPLYGSVEAFSQVLSMATELLKASSDSELRVSTTQIEVAWVLIGGLMSLGPNFVKIHLSQLLLLWRNALPMPLTQENATKRGPLEISFLAHVRGSALGAMLVFLEYNGSLVTTDGSRRIATMLQNTIAFYESVAAHRLPEETASRLISALQLQDLIIMVQRRVLQCFTKLIGLTHLENTLMLSQSNLVSLAITAFAELENAPHQNIESSIASSASNFESLWDLADNWGFGVNGLVRGYSTEVLGRDRHRKVLGNLELVLDEEEVDGLLSSPVCKALEHDSIHLYLHDVDAFSREADSPSTQVVNAAIDLFAVALPLQPPKVQESSFEQLALLQSRPYSREPGKKAALHVNIATAILSTLAVANRETRFSSGNLAVSLVHKIAADIMQEFITDGDPYVRNIGVESMGRMCNLFGSSFTTSHVRHLVDTIVAKRDPNTRAGCALALGRIYGQVGGMAAGFHLKTIVGVLLSLCNDPHPIVHFWALYGLNQVADSAGLNFSGYVASTLGMVAQLFSNDSHTEEAVSLATSNLEFEDSTTFLITKSVDSLINVLGPDLQDMNKERRLIECLVDYFCREESIQLVIEGSLCSGHLSLYMPEQTDFADYVRNLQRGLDSAEERIRDIAVDNLNDLIKRDANKVFMASGLSLEHDLWLIMDKNPDHAGIQKVLQNWLHQTWEQDTDGWIQRCQDVIAKTRSKPKPVAINAKPAAALPDLQDEEVAGFAAAAAAAQGESADSSQQVQEFLKWQTRSFAVSCLSQLITLVAQTTLPDQATRAETALQGRIADVIRIAFSASTANAVDLRILGLRIIDQILKLFGKTPDPDFIEASLLEQYQAQISSALTPAFAPDSSPELASEAINVCATFVGAGIVTSVERMGRIFKLLVTGLENITEPSANFSIGDLKVLSSNAQTMLRLSILSAWAQLQIASIEQRYLEAIVEPHVGKLTPLWLSSLQDFAKLRFEPDISSSLGGPGNGQNLNDLYSAFNRETLLHLFQDTWLNLMDAIAVLVDKDSNFVLDALNKRKSAPAQNSIDANGSENDMNSREEPVAFFFILYGLAFEVLVAHNRDSSSQTLKILQALQKLLLPSVSGNALYQDAVFDETLDTFDRLALTEGLGIQKALVGITRRLALDHQVAKAGTDGDGELSDVVQQLFELTRVMILVLVGMVPTMDQSANHHVRPLSDEAVALICAALNALVDVAEVFPVIIRSDLYACIVQTFCSVFGSGICQWTVVPQAFPIFKRFLQSTTFAAQVRDVERLIRGCLYQILKIMAQAKGREDDYALACAKNTLLAITILLTSAGFSLPTNDALANQAVEQIFDALHEPGLTPMAASCLRSLLLSKPKSQLDEVMFRRLLPRMLDFVIRKSAENQDAARDVVVQTLVSAVKSVPSTSRSSLSAIIVPALLKRCAMEGSSSHKTTATRLLDIAGGDQAAFRGLVSQMGPEQREFLERVLRSNPGQTGAIDDVHRAIGELDGSDSSKISEGKSIIEQLAKMKYELQHNRALTPLEDDGEPDVEIYNRELAAMGNASWHDVEWLYSECYLYRRVGTMFGRSRQWKSYDVFARQKMSTFKSSKPAVLELAGKYRAIVQQIRAKGAAVSSQDAGKIEEAEKVLFQEMCEICLWGNATDLSLLTTLSYEDIQKLQGSKARKDSEKNVLVNELPAAFECLRKAKREGRKARVAFVLDNAGFELFVDLILAGYLLAEGLASEVTLHPKSIPWFVSDVMPKDLADLLNALADPQSFYASLPGSQDGEATTKPLTDDEAASLKFLFDDWSHLHGEGKLMLRPSRFWTHPGSFWRMPSTAPDVFDDLKQCELVIFKGDLNYRKLTGDATWDPTLPFHESLGPLGRGSGMRTLALRTCKADVVVGLPPGRDEELRQLEGGGGDSGARKWTWSGKWAVVQMCDGKEK